MPPAAAQNVLQALFAGQGSKEASGSLMQEAHRGTPGGLRAQRFTEPPSERAPGALPSLPDSRAPNNEVFRRVLPFPA